MVHYDKYLCCIVAAIVILVAGCINPVILQSTDSEGKPSGHPSYIWMAVLAFLGGALACMLQQQM